MVHEQAGRPLGQIVPDPDPDALGGTQDILQKFDCVRDGQDTFGTGVFTGRKVFCRYSAVIDRNSKFVFL